MTVLTQESALGRRAKILCEYGTHHSYVLVVHTLRVAENEILKLDLPGGPGQNGRHRY
jgi:hypothetical protein